MFNLVFLKVQLRVNNCYSTFLFLQTTVRSKTQNSGKGRLKCAITIVLQCNEMKIMSNKSTKYVSRQSKKGLVVIVVENVKKIYIKQAQDPDHLSLYMYQNNLL